MKRIPALDGLRGIAISLVLFWHYSFVFRAEPHSIRAYLQAPAAIGWSGVDLFFVLSGFLIGGILIDSRGKHDYFLAFFRRRAVRILPLYFTVLFFGIAFFPGDAGPPFVALLSFTQNIWDAITGDMNFWFGHSWSLAVEEQFYLLLPLVIYFCPSRRLPTVIVAIAIAVPLYRLAVVQGFNNWAVANYVLLPARMDALSAGVLVAIALRSPSWRAWLTKHIWLAYVVTVAAAMVAITGTLRTWSNVGSYWALGYSFVALMYAGALTIIVVKCPVWASRLLELPPLPQLGTLSFCIYLIHPLILWTCLEHVQTALIAFVLSSLTIVGVAWASWRYLEGPLLSMERRMSRRGRSILSATDS
jgi:peptidoglycan/LPS O-acetylase OafA/YrhL